MASIYVGSAKGTKYGMCEEKLYKHKDGWWILRAKSPSLLLDLARNMRICCSNKNLYYNQAKRLEINQRGINTTRKTAGDCSSTVRACIQHAGYNVPNFTTATEVNTLCGTGLFEKLEYDEKKLKNGDILVTKKKGHTVIVTSGADIQPQVPIVAQPTLRKGSKGVEVKKLQADLNYLGIASLEVDGDFGSKTGAAVKKYQKKFNLVCDEIYGYKSFNKMKELI